MKIILSRKGFDTSAGGVPSPLLPDGTLRSLPIPDRRSTIRYRDIVAGVGDDGDIGKLVSDLTGRRIRPGNGAHLDPDLERDALPRAPGWRPLFGQSGSAQGHLRNQAVTRGDIFLFFGLFQQVEQVAGRYRFIRGAPRQHRLFGWLQVDACRQVAAWDADRHPWACYHPHFNHPRTPGNVLYLAAHRLQLPHRTLPAIPGAGLFHRAHPHRQLTSSRAPGPSHWQLPAWFYPARNRPPLSYHANPARWQKTGDHTLLQAASRGQEFVLDCHHYPEATDWLHSLFEDVSADR